MADALSDTDTACKACRNFCTLFYPDDNSWASGRGQHFWAFVGATKPLPLHNGNGWMLPEEVTHRIKFLSGPHYRTVAIAMLAKGHQYKEPL